ncbi:hypothetical protein ROA7450_00482 [Roseovarius albus]|uniref:DUF177 domain-containing protein n=1 Tax=Roseovarius albus TaxID=1247867 RepID=A0A1X6YCU0_9RHOB|nr:DUF177 domain-containing protein [Roseovarius albus]SLN16841.1 hypothetical protein ROA7450_00482 [Roseovarius albus]
MQDQTHTTTSYYVAKLSPHKPVAFKLTPDSAKCDAIAQSLGLEGLRKLRFAGELKASGKANWLISAELGATIVQPCIVTLAPVTTRIDQSVSRLFVKKMPEQQLTGDGFEMQEDDTLEPLGEVIDIESIMIESLALALPDYPRSENGALEQQNFAEPGVTPMTDEDTRPFAGLSALKAKLEKPE